MPEPEPLPLEIEAEAPEDPVKIRVKKLLDDFPEGPYSEIVRVGFRALDSGDHKLAIAAADHVIERAPPSSGDLMRAQALRGFIYDTQGETRRSTQLLEAIIRGDF